MRMRTIVAKDLFQIITDWKSALFLVVMPVLFTVFFATILKPAYNGESEDDPGLPVGVLRPEPAGILADRLVEMLDGSEVVRVVKETGRHAAAEERVAEGELSALLAVPDRYTQRLLDGDAAKLPVVADRYQAGGRAAIQVVETAAGRLLAAVEAARISAELRGERAPFVSPTARREYLLQGVNLALSAWERPPIAVASRPELGNGATDTPPGQDDEPRLTAAIQASSGMMIQFAVFGLITAAMVMVLERRSGALKRLLATPVRRGTIIAGHVIAIFVVVIVQLAILVAVGRLVYGLPYLQAPLALLVMLGSLGVWAASLGLLIGTLAKTEDHVVVLSLVAMFVFTSLGGAWFPLEIAGGAFAAVGRFMPTAWALEGLQNIILRDRGLRSVLLPAAVVLGYAAVFFALATLRFQTETAR
jgi:ABC-2 type transport system permease protein